ncbi:hypothetical protein [Vibrio fluvialis]|uniref:hypothetical protein n=1 Tax=Vibrio fluvialis TaxID=676 RepID=UPI00192BFA32|nr:hypothetical protein [Vibrio fluvialis]MBL4283911.1 hypothetical protein [Vibrio fluvialis]
MKELNLEEINIVSGGIRGADRDTVKVVAKVVKAVVTRSVGSLVTHSAPLNKGEDEFLDNMRRGGNRRNHNRDIDRHDRREGHTHRASGSRGGRSIEN